MQTCSVGCTLAIGSGDILVRMCGSWENFVVHLRTFRRIFRAQVKPVTLCLCYALFAPLTRPAVHFLKCSNACRPVQWDVHLPLDQVIYLCACVEVGRISWYICALSDAFSEPKWNSDIMPLLCSFAPLTRPAVHFFKCSYACRPVQWDVTLANGSGDILVRMCGSWENFVVHLRTFRRIFQTSEAVTMPLLCSICACHTTCSTLF